jgi:O-antigen/teichoic acid export membrane protein
VLPASYSSAAAYVPVLALGVAIQAASWLPTTSLNIAKATRYYPLITTTSAVMAIAANAALVPRFELMGAAWAMALAQTVQLAVTLRLSQRAYRIPYEAVRLGKILGVGAVTLAATSAVTPGSPVWTLVARLAVLGVFPVGLVAVRLFSAEERADLRTLLPIAIRPRTPATAAAPPPDETVL